MPWTSLTSAWSACWIPSLRPATIPCRRVPGSTWWLITIRCERQAGPAVGSNTHGVRDHGTILYEYLKSQDISFSTRLATALFYAIKSEPRILGGKLDGRTGMPILPFFPSRTRPFCTRLPVPGSNRRTFVPCTRRWKMRLSTQRARYYYGGDILSGSGVGDGRLPGAA